MLKVRAGRGDHILDCKALQVYGCVIRFLRSGLHSSWRGCSNCVSGWAIAENAQKQASDFRNQQREN
jgi:hypothetical protein